MKKIITTISFIFLPFWVYAQAAADAKSLVGFITNLFNKRLIPIMILLALIYIIYGVIEYIRAVEDSQGREEKKQKIFWGIIGLFVILTVWSLVFIIAHTFGVFVGGTLNAG